MFDFFMAVNEVLIILRDSETVKREGEGRGEREAIIHFR